MINDIMLQPKYKYNQIDNLPNIKMITNIFVTRLTKHKNNKSKSTFSLFIYSKIGFIVIFKLQLASFVVLISSKLYLKFIQKIL